MIKRWMVVIGLWLARKGGWEEVQPLPLLPVPLDQAIFASAQLLVAQAEGMKVSGEYRRREVLRGLMNRHPDATVKDLALAIELAVR